MPVYVEQWEIERRFMSIIMNLMPAIITTLLASLKYAVVLYTEQINIDQVLHFQFDENFVLFSHVCQYCC